MFRSSVMGLIYIAMLLTSFSCTSVIYKSNSESTKEETYDSGFPNSDCSKQLEEISQSIYRVNSIAFYKVYIFSDTSTIKRSDITDKLIEERQVKSTYVDRTSSGTSLLIYSSGGKVLLLTCAHIIDFPDTIVTYFSNSKGVFTNDVQSIGFKEKETIYIASFPGDSQVKEFLIDKHSDLALLGNNYGPTSKFYFSVFNFPFGNSKQLEWGDFVYLFGYPMNYKMVSKAIVSSPNYDKEGSFLIDAVVNRGYSGGIVLALKGGVPNFEFVGIVQWITDENENILVPAPLEAMQKYDPTIPYKGEMFAKQLQLLRYGITRVIPTEIIKDFLIRNDKYLKQNGYSISILEK